MRALAHLPDRARRRGDLGIEDGLDRVDREHVGRDLADAVRDRGQRRLGDDEQRRRERLQPPGAQAHLLDRLLRADEQAAGAGRGHAPHRLEQQRALADAGLAAEQRDRAGDQSAAEHPVELGHAGGAPAAAIGSTSARGITTPAAAVEPSGTAPVRSSTRLDHAPHSVQRPSHFGAWASHSVQR